MTWVFAALVTVSGQAWIDFDVYMPDCWAKDPRRRRKAGIPEDLEFATKPELAIEQLKRVMAAGVRALWAAADEVYGRCGEFRDACRALSLAYVVIIPCDYRVTLAKDKVIRADEAVAGAVFERRSCGNGTKGPRYSDWALIATADPREFLLIRRLDREKNQYTFYLSAPRSALPYSPRSGERLEGISLDLMAYPGPKGWPGKIACQETSSRVQAYGTACWEVRVIWRNLDWLNPNLQKVQERHPPERRLKPALAPAAGRLQSQ